MGNPHCIVFVDNLEKDVDFDVDSPALDVVTRAWACVGAIILRMALEGGYSNRTCRFGTVEVSGATVLRTPPQDLPQHNICGTASTCTQSTTGKRVFRCNRTRKEGFRVPVEGRSPLRSFYRQI
mmetsp:Transcript_10887/g.21551  ORF Transcript_10887/g.21551 Transcript_10887/m.21551 type:complete len:124 (+) Transcript_10887:3-374(+)